MFVCECDPTSLTFYKKNRYLLRGRPQVLMNFLRQQLNIEPSRSKMNWQVWSMCLLNRQTARLCCCASRNNAVEMWQSLAWYERFCFVLLRFSKKFFHWPVFHRLHPGLSYKTRILLKYQLLFEYYGNVFTPSWVYLHNTGWWKHALICIFCSPTCVYPSKNLWNFWIETIRRPVGVWRW